MNLAQLRSEIVADPAALGYAGKTAQQVADLLNAPTRQIAAATLDGQDLLDAVVPAEYSVLTADQKNLLHALFARASVRISGTNTQNLLKAMPFSLG